MKDPYYRKILEGLEGPLDPAAFEACAVALLEEVYPGLVPVHGGQDYGMDGAVPDGEGEAYPLIVTTAQDVLRNLTKSLESYPSGGGTRTRAVLATSNALTPTRRKNLQARAKEKGFVLVQIHDQRDIADRLYRNSRWAKELLSVTPEPSALSAVPRTRRPVREDVELIGREADLIWLRETSGDRLILGQPGAGKTYLLLQLVREGKALFLASEDEGRIAADVRDLQPEIVIVDDAHLEPETLVRLRQVREEVGGAFDLLATGWPGTEDELAEALALPSSESVRTLELLTRKQILKVLQGIGIQEPDDDPYLRELIDQAANKPGLAVTLGSLWLRGEWQEVLTGAAIKWSLIPALKRVLESDPTDLLGCFALGGDRGMSMEVVREYLGLDRAQIRQQVVGASHGGVLQVLRDDRLAVQPEALRPVLLGEVFFTPPVLDYRALMTQAVDPGEVAETLALAALRGVPVPTAELRELVGAVASRDAWRSVAALDEDSGRWALESYPGPTHQIIGAVLRTAPRAAIRRLLDEAVGATGPLHSQPSHPLRILQDWLKEIPFARGRSDRFFPEESLRRRRLIVEIAGERFGPEKEHERRVVAARVALLALSPWMESSRDAATRDAVSLHRASLPPTVNDEILELWKSVLDPVGDLIGEVWGELSTLIDHWIHPLTTLSDETRKQMWAVPRQILLDLREFAAQRPALGSVLSEWAERVGLELDLPLDDDFEALFPSVHAHVESGEELREALERQYERARSLAREWAERPPREQTGRLAALHAEATTFGRLQSIARSAFYRELAERVDDPVVWASFLLHHGLEPQGMEPLLRRAIGDRCSGWEELLKSCFRNESYSALASAAVIRAKGMPEELVQAVISRVWPQWVDTACHQGEVPLPTLKILLRSPSEEVALAAAVGEWMAEPEGCVRSELQTDWRRAILRFGSETECDDLPGFGPEYWLKAIFQADPDLALEWLEARLLDAGELERAGEDGVYRAAVRALDEPRRRQLLGTVDAGYLSGQLIPWIVEDSVELYKCLLGRESLRRHHLAPLAQESLGDRWRELAPLAVEAGHEAREVASRVVLPAFSGWGYGIDRWSAWVEVFEDLLGAEAGPLREIAVHGSRIAREQLERAESEKRHHDLTGSF